MQRASRLTNCVQDRYEWSEYAASDEGKQKIDTLLQGVGTIENARVPLERLRDLPGYVRLGDVDQLRNIRTSIQADMERFFYLRIANRNEFEQDTIIFTVPISRTVSDFENICEKAAQIFSRSEYGEYGREDVLEEMLDWIAQTLEGIWFYMTLHNTVTVTDDSITLND